MSILYTPHTVVVVWTSATNAAAWLRHRTDYCAFLLERREPHGVRSPCGHSCTVCYIVCLRVMPSFSDITGVSVIGHSFKTGRSRTPISRRAVRRRHYTPIIKYPKTARSVVGVEPTTFMTIKTSASTETATAAFIYIYI